MVAEFYIEEEIKFGAVITVQMVYSDIISAYKAKLCETACEGASWQGGGVKGGEKDFIQPEIKLQHVHRKNE